jgi:hypothetical protein
LHSRTKRSPDPRHENLSLFIRYLSGRMQGSAAVGSYSLRRVEIQGIRSVASGSIAFPPATSSRSYGVTVMNSAWSEGWVNRRWCVGRAFSTVQTGLRGNELEMRFVAKSTVLANRKYTFVDLRVRSGETIRLQLTNLVAFA